MIQANKFMDDSNRIESIETDYYDIKVELDNVIEGSKKVLMNIFPHWELNGLKFTQETTGMTNKLIKVTSLHRGIKNIVLIRIYGRGTDLLIDRKNELKNLSKLSSLGFCPSLYGHFINGMCYGFVPGLVFTTSDMLDPHKAYLVAKHMASWHKIDLEGEKKPVFFETLEKWLGLLPSSFTKEENNIKLLNAGFSKELAQKEYLILRENLLSFNSPVVFCHNDVQIGNIIYNPNSDSVSFIDFEYGFISFQAFDIANHFCEFGGFECDWSKYPSKDFQMVWLANYLKYYHGREAKSNEIESLYKEVLCFSLASHFLWSIWALVQTEISDLDFDYAEYARGRLEVYFSLKEKIFAESLNKL